ncbi:hypothetical protein [Streptomyces sp. NBC_01451]|uniref:hypothetical protein n=1 Tax=Streptomyces sp. NBC_01451 TaxID=2903872 RepID=UPI002E32904F|nr:hypothetical protein [Streptomyces sp. NBC_01451]
MPFIRVSELFGNYLIVVDKAAAVLLALGYLALLLCIPYLANKQQPTPNWKQEEK